MSRTSPRLARRVAQRPSYAEEDDSVDAMEESSSTSEPVASTLLNGRAATDENRPNRRFKIGQKVVKQFSSGWFEGQVVERDCHVFDDDGNRSSTSLYLVKYEDGDREHLTHEEMQQVLATPLALKRALHRRQQEQASSNVTDREGGQVRTSSRHTKRKASPLRPSLDDGPLRPQNTKKTKTSKPKDTINRSQQPTLDNFFTASASPTTRSKGRSVVTTVDDDYSFALSSDKDESEQEDDADVDFDDEKDPTDSQEESDGESEVPDPKRARKVAAAKPKVSSKKTTSTKRARKVSSSKPKTSINKTGNSQEVRSTLKQPYEDGDGLPIINQPQLMFDDIIQNCTQEKKIDLQPFLQTFQNRTLKVATMCSGTESPILALDMLQNSLRDLVPGDGSNNQPLTVEHVFSCEIEPFKQAFIERNYRPPLLFRDIRELGRDQAHTAYGGLFNVPNTPGSVDLLIAGTSCVDYSNLNNQKKEIEAKGESGQTFYGMMDWIVKAKPPLVIIENVFSAPWDEKVKAFEKIGYSATFARLDTKQYYIPHTRQRGYLFAVLSSKKIKHDPRPEQWQAMVEQLKRPASAALDAFMLPNDDPRVLRGRARLTAESYSSGEGSNGGARAGRTDWSKCETRHQRARSTEELGDARPLTNWSEVASTRMPGFAWNDWIDAQVHRVLDLIDINTLRLAQLGMDPTFKTMIWNLSQNVDRDTIGKLGLCQCLTPSGVPYVTNRGGPLVGEELLLLQGIPSDDLLLTKESEDNLKDLAGNAMSTTVVGVCMLAALVVGHKAIKASPQLPSTGEVVSNLVPRPLVPASRIKISREFGTYEKHSLNLGPITLQGQKEWEAFLAEATSSARKCLTEGPEEALPFLSEKRDKHYPLVCLECGGTSSTRSSSGSFDEHNYVPMESVCPRVQPSAFRHTLHKILPMWVNVSGLDVDQLKQPEGCDSPLWLEWTQRLRSTVGAEGAPADFRLAKIVRSSVWTAFYVCRGKGSLELIISEKGVLWLLFAGKSGQKSEYSSMLERPFARMYVKGPDESSSPWSLAGGVWEVCLPVDAPVSLQIKGEGKKVDSWRKRLGLKGSFQNETEFESLSITVLSGADAELKARVEGTYDILPKCGGACGSLRKKLPVSNGSGSTDLFLFLESGRKTHPSEDGYVFAVTCHRTSYEEYRDTILQLDKAFRPFDLSSKQDEDYCATVSAHATGKWITVEGASMTSPCLSPCATFPSTSDSLTVPVYSSALEKAPELVSCQIPVGSSELLFEQCKRLDGNAEVNLNKSKQIFEDISFITSRLSISDVFAAQSWQLLDRTNVRMVGDDDQVCEMCAPSKPGVEWRLVGKGRKLDYKPIEDGQEAAKYERAMKARPDPWIVRLSIDVETQVLSLQIGFNATSLVQRALGLFPKHSLPRRAMITASPEKSCCSYEWRVVPHLEKSHLSFPKLLFTSNKQDEEAEQPPGFNKYKLRKEQLRSLKWMLMQESGKTGLGEDAYFEEEEVAESILPGMNWRAEGRVRRPVLVRGGIIADEVGYGKTAITLGLIDAAASVNGAPPGPHKEVATSFIPTAATLVVVPAHLMGQWPDEVHKFLGSKRGQRVQVIKDMKCFNNLTIDDIKKAEIVIVNFGVLSNPKYYSRLARLSGISPGSLPTGTDGGRRFEAVYDECLCALGKRVSQIVEGCENVYDALTSDADAHVTAAAVSAVRHDSKKSAYKVGEDAEQVHAASFKVEASELDPWGLRLKSVKTKYERMKSPPLEMFFWNRVVVDEFTYLCDKTRQRASKLVHQLKSSFRWLLSGTPAHRDFNDVKALANLLGLHLGVDEALPGTKLTKKLQQDTTGLESMSHFLEVRSTQWHERRHQFAQHFLDRFVRQNIAEIDEIPFDESVLRLQLPPAERAIYLELETHLKSLEMNSKNAKTSKKKTTGDRDDRVQKAIVDADSAEEALLKCCSHFNMSSNATTASETLDDIIKKRESEKDQLARAMTFSIASAYRQQRRILANQPSWKAVLRTEKGEIHDALNEYLGFVDRKDSVVHGADDETNSLIMKIVKDAEVECNSDPYRIDAKFAEINGDELPSDSESDNGGNSKNRKKSKKPKTSVVDEERLFAMKLALRDHMHEVRTIGKALCGRLRSLRFIQRVRDFQTQQAEHNCRECGAKPRSQMGVLSCCGHVGCVNCLKVGAARTRCIDPMCMAQANWAHIIPSSDLGLDNKESSGRYGCKLTAVVEKVNKVLKTGDRLIVFCQFEDLKNKVEEALSGSGIPSMQVRGTVQQQTNAVAVFQKPTLDKKDPRVLILKMDDEQSAGLNLTNLNHAIFVHPLFAETQEKYNAYETQAIGRIRRYGQEKTVFVWRFLVDDTIDTRIYEERASHGNRFS